ncbi:polysaccharide biosynthesis tyrosine autokinase [uncultured Leifsonia sp.]|uniref:polysaccharide biosynthesis tyrosine autokinase n=1 Tax=uncultured Leifsonia sp. TaxID=340359 RepID=UPI0028D0B067|nr:polysaccharide biosynthesis tyrosine autokinase [uncultured Leifsonia sp.]
MDLRDYLRVFHKNWILIALCALLGVAVAAVFSLMATPKYKAETELYVSVRAGDSAATTDLVQGTSFARQAVTSYVSVVDSASVLDRVIDELKLDTTPSALAAKISAESPLNTVLIDITVTDDDPKRAADIANSVGKNTSYIVTNKLENAQGGASLVNVQTIQPATTPTRPSSPNVPLNVVLGLLVGLGVGILASFLRSILDTRIHNAHDIEQVTDRPILGAVSFDPSARKRPLIVHADPRNPRAESFRSLRTNLQFVNIGGPRSYVITSSVPGEGKSTTAANLAISLAETGARVALIDGDLRLPKVAEYMGIEGAVGLTDVLIGRAELTDVLQKWGRGQLYVLPAGAIPPNPSELLGSSVMANLINDLSSEFDFVLVDAPPLLLVTDAAVISKLTGGAILAAASGRTKKNELAAAVRALEHIDSRLIGVVVTMLPVKGPDSYGYGVYGYGVQNEIVDEEMTDHRVRRAAQA